MCLRGLSGKERTPIGLARQVARQIRTTYSPSPTPDERRSQVPKILVIGDPGDPSRDENLPGARKEAMDVMGLLESKGCAVTGLIGAPGTELPSHPGVAGHADRFDVVRHMIGRGYDIIHYCGHCDFDPDNPDRVGWLFSSGMLTAREIENMDRAPSLVVANACLSSRTSARIASGDLKTPHDEASLLPTLADEFFRQGVRNYVGTAWSVNDQGAVQFARVLYDSFLQSLQPPRGNSLGEALFHARQTLNRHSHRYGALWAAYQHYGDPGFTIRDIVPDRVVSE
jgi:hypothetical protein